VEALLDEFAGDDDVGGHGAASALDGVDGGGFLVRAEVSRERDERGGRLALDDFAGLAGGDRGHVHSHRVLGVVGKAQEDRVADDVGLDVEQLAVARRGLGSLPEHLEIGLNPLDGLGGLGDAGHAKDRRSSHAVFVTRASAPPAERITPSPRLTDASSAPSVVASGR